MTQALGLTRGRTPCASTLHGIFKGLDIRAFERVLEGGAEEVVRDAEGPRRRLRGRALDGKTLRGSKKQGAPGTHLLSLVTHTLGITLVQQAVDEKTNEIPASLEVLRRLVFTGEVITVDALLTQRSERLPRRSWSKVGPTSSIAGWSRSQPAWSAMSPSTV